MHEGEEVLVGIGFWQSETKGGFPFSHRGADFEEVQPDGIESGGGEYGFRKQGVPVGMQKGVGGAVQE